MKSAVCFFAILYILNFCLANKSKTYYEVLGINKNATPREIKQGYMKMALKYHPDKNDSPDATEIFIKATEAHEVLRDPDERKKYDRMGHEAYIMERNGQPFHEKPTQEHHGGSHGFGDFFGSQEHGGPHGFYFHHSDPFEHFEQFFRQEHAGFRHDDDVFAEFFQGFDDMFNRNVHKRRTLKRKSDGTYTIEIQDTPILNGHHFGDSFFSEFRHEFKSVKTKVTGHPTLDDIFEEHFEDNFVFDSYNSKTHCEKVVFVDDMGNRRETMKCK